MALDYEEIGTNIKLHRVRKRLKQAELAELVDASSQHISHIECGKTKVSLPLLLRLSEALSADLYTLLGKNINTQPEAAMAGELANILKGASKTQQSLCFELCRTAMECTNHHQGM